MPRRADSFARALKDAEKRLEKALAERVEAQAKLAHLQTEIPSLMQVIEALQLKQPDRVVYLNSKTGEETPPKALGPEELAKWYADRDLSQVGSILPPKPVAPSVPVGEDELLPEDFAVGKRK